MNKIEHKTKKIVVVVVVVAVVVVVVDAKRSIRRKWIN